MDIIYTTARQRISHRHEMTESTTFLLEDLFLPPEQRHFPDAAGVVDDDPRVAQLYRGQEAKSYQDASIQHVMLWGTNLVHGKLLTALLPRKSNKNTSP